MNQEDNEKVCYHFYNSIKVFISLLKFQNDLKMKVENNMNNPKQKLVLIDKKWLEDYKNFYLHNELLKLIKENDLTIDNPFDQKLLFINMFNRFTSKNNNKKILLFYNKKEEFPKIVNYKINSNISFISEFEIISEEVYENLKRHMGDLNISSSDSENKKFEYVIYDRKIIIKYNRPQEICFVILIGRLDNDKYILEMMVNYKKNEQFEADFNKLFDQSNNILSQFYNIKEENNNIIDITQDFISQDNFNYNNIKLIINGYSDINKVQFTNNPSNEEKSNIDSKKIIKFFIKLYQEYKDIKTKINIDSNNNFDLDYYLINKNWIDKFKEYYYYKEVVENIDRNNQFNNINEDNIDDFLNSFPQELLNKIDKNNKELIYNLSNISLFFVNYNFCEIAKKENQDYIKIYKDFEIWTESTINLFRDIGLNLYNKPKIVKCYFGENHIFLFTKNDKNEFLNIYHLSELNINLNYEAKMVIKCKYMRIILEKIKNKFFLKYLYTLNGKDIQMFKISKTDGDGEAYLLSEEGKIYDTIHRKNKRIGIIINILICIEEIKRKMKKNIKETFQNNKNEKEKFYLVHKKLFQTYLEQRGLFDTYNILKKEKLVERYSDNMPIEERKNKIRNFIKEKINIDTQNKYELLSNASLQYNIANQNVISDFIITRNNNEKIFYYDNYYLLGEEIIGLINEKFKEYFTKCNCLFGDKKIFIFELSTYKNLIEIGKLDSDGAFKIELIIDIFNNYEKEEKKLFDLGYNMYYSSFFVFTNEDGKGNISPLFDESKKLKGYGYKINQKSLNNYNNNFSDYDINNILIKIIYLIIYFKRYKTK